MSNQLPAKKYRPSLTVNQMIHIVNRAKEDYAQFDAPDYDTLNLSIISTLAPFLSKIENDALVASYNPSLTSAKPSTLESLGGSPSIDSLLEQTKEQYWEACYKKLQTLGASDCTVVELDAAQEHKYLNDLMSPDEMLTFEGK